MHVLGISCFYHDSAAALVSDGQLVAAAEEERFNRIKHYSGFPKCAVEYCLKEAGITINDVHHIAFYEKPKVKLRRLLADAAATWPASFRLWTKGIPDFLSKKLPISRIIRDTLGTDQEVLYCDHHLSHAASAFLVSPFDEAAIITADGVGEWTTTAWGVGRGVDMKVEKELRFPHSVGLLFSAITNYLGFRVNDAEWKVMGLAPYGEPKYVDRFRDVVDIKDDGSFRLNMKYFDFVHSASSTISAKWAELFRQPQRLREMELTQFHSDIACSGQKIVEEIMVKMATHVHRTTGLNQLCVAGGVGLNCVANWRMLVESGFQDIFIQPAAGDSGGALGTAFYVYNSVQKNPREFVMDHSLWGPSFSDEEILDTLKRNSACFTSTEDEEELIQRTAQMIADGKVVAWFQGRLEYGPRALGARSLLADPRNPQMKDIINSKVKFRESFRPFAPAVLKEKAHEYLEVPEGMDAPFMLLVPKVRPEKRDVIPAVTHEDGTGRLQTVTERSNPLYYRVIKRFGEMTGVPVVINTSFNVRGEPIVCAPQDAYETFMKTGIDALVMGKYVLTEKDSDVDAEAGYKSSDALESGGVSDVVYPFF